jgi:glycosyltransferase involved in cell wall biosynthesis
MQASGAPLANRTGHVPKVSIGMPAYNGEATIAAAIESLLAQTFDDFELIVGDNASTDATAEVANRYAKADPRVRVVRRAANLGANANYSRLVREARGKYFKWASCNDWCAPSFLERCVEVLDARPEVVVAYPRTRLYAASRSDATDFEDDLDLQQDDPTARFWHVRSHMRLNNAMNGLIRMSALHRTRLIAAYDTADVVLIGRLALLGKFVEIPEYLFYRRMTPETVAGLRSTEDRMRHFYPGLGAAMLFQSWRNQFGWSGAVLSAPIPAATKLRLLPRLLRGWYWSRRALADDLLEAGQWVVHGRAH